MNILILTNKLPYPPRDGGSIATLNMLTGLWLAGNDVTCLALNTRKHAFPVDRIPNELSSAIRFFGIDCDSSIKPLRLITNLLFSNAPYVAERFNVSEYREKLSEILDQKSFDLIQLEGPYLGHYLKEVRKLGQSSVSLRTHNVEHLIWKRKASNEKSFLKRWYFRNMASRLETYELKVLQQADFLIPISPQDEAFFTGFGFKGPVLTIPTGLSLKDYPMSPLPGDSTIFFIGALDWLPNQEGLTWFLENVFKDLVMEIPQVRFHIAGRNAPAFFIKKLNHKNITYHGEVADAKVFMQSYRVMVAPLLTGSGIRIKILEGMALGRPVVTTLVGIEGIPAKDQREVLVADDPGTFRAHLSGLLTNEETASLQVTRARQLIKHNFDTFGLSTRLSQFFKAQV